MRDAWKFRGCGPLASLDRAREMLECTPHASATSPDGSLLEYETLELRIHPPNVTVDNETYEDRTIITVDSANRPGTLVEVVQTLTELGLSIKMARISSDGGWFVDEFHVSEAGGGRVLDVRKLSLLTHMLDLSREHGGSGARSDSTTVCQMVGSDSVGVLADIMQLLHHNGCDIRSAAVWTYQGRAAAVVDIGERGGGAVGDTLKLGRLREILLGLMQEREAGVAAALVSFERVEGQVHHERRLHQLMLTDEYRAWQQLGTLQHRHSLPFPARMPPPSPQSPAPPGGPAGEAGAGRWPPAGPGGSTWGGALGGGGEGGGVGDGGSSGSEAGADCEGGGGGGALDAGEVHPAAALLDAAGSVAAVAPAMADGGVQLQQQQQQQPPGTPTKGGRGVSPQPPPTPPREVMRALSQPAPPPPPAVRSAAPPRSPPPPLPRSPAPPCSPAARRPPPSPASKRQQQQHQQHQLTLRPPPQPQQPQQPQQQRSSWPHMLPASPARSIPASPGAAGCHPISCSLSTLLDLQPAWQDAVEQVPLVTVQHVAHSNYWLVSISCADRNKLCFDTVCTLADLRYDVYHATIDTDEAAGAGAASQLFYVRPRFGEPWDAARAAALRAMLVRAVQRRFPPGLRVQVHVAPGTSGALSRLIGAFASHGLTVARCTVRPHQQLYGSHTFYLMNAATSQVPSRDQVRAACVAAGGLELSQDHSRAHHQHPHHQQPQQHAGGHTTAGGGGGGGMSAGSPGLSVAALRGLELRGSFAFNFLEPPRARVADCGGADACGRAAAAGGGGGGGGGGAGASGGGGGTVFGGEGSAPVTGAWWVVSGPAGGVSAGPSRTGSGAIFGSVAGGEHPGGGAPL